MGFTLLFHGLLLALVLDGAKGVKKSDSDPESWPDPGEPDKEWPEPDESIMKDMRPEGEKMTWEAYNRLSTIHKWMSDMAKAHPKEITVMDIGRSTQNRKLLVMKISFPGKNRKIQAGKPAALIEGGMHGLEWIAPAAVTYIANHLISKLTKSGGSEPFSRYDWYFLPVMNPDGYEYTTTSFANRFWRKSMSGWTSNSTSDDAFGVDLNRNFEYEWKLTIGNNITSRGTYSGATPASEPEVRALQSFFLKHKGSIKLYVTLHCYSQVILFPHAYTGVKIDNYDERMRIGNLSAEAVKQLKYNLTYEVDQVARMLYIAHGSSIDYATEVGKVDHAYVIEMRPDGPHWPNACTGCFHLPPKEIVEGGEEALTAVRVMASEVFKTLPASGGTLAGICSKTLQIIAIVMTTISLVLH